MSCGYACLRSLMIVFNSIFLLFGLAVVGVGIWVTIDFSALLPFLPSTISQATGILQGFGIALTGVGALIIVQASLGCIGAFRESQCLLSTFFVIMVAIFAVVLTAPIIFLTHKDWVQDVIQDVMTYEAEIGRKDGLLVFANGMYNCCGIIDQPSKKCDRDYPPKDHCPSNSTFCQHGCLNALWNGMFQPYIDIFTGVLFALSFVVAIGAIFSITLCCLVKQRDDVWAYHRELDHNNNVNRDYSYKHD